MQSKDKYKYRRGFNKFMNFLWSTAMKLLLLVICIVVFIFAAPWLKILWNTISGSEFRN